MFTLKPMVFCCEDDVNAIINGLLDLQENLTTLKLLGDPNLSDNDFLKIISRFYDINFRSKEEIIAKMLNIPRASKVKHQEVEFSIKNLPNSSFIANLYSETGDYGNAVIPDMITLKNMVTGKNIAKVPCIITGWSESLTGRKLLDAKDMDENVLLWNILGKKDADLNDLEFYKELLISIFKREFTEERIANDIIMYINDLKAIVREFGFMLESRKLAVTSEALTIRNCESILSGIENLDTGRKA